MGTPITVSLLCIYPIKSCRGINLTEAAITPTGLQFDRQFLVVDEQTGWFVTQRTAPEMTLIAPEISSEALSSSLDELVASNSKMTIRAPGMAPLQVPLGAPATTAKARQVKVWDYVGEGVDMGDMAAEWFSEYLKKSVRLVRFTGRRPTDEKYAKGYETAFSDGFPMLVASEESLADLNGRLQVNLPMSRFRPNIIVKGSGAWDEDNWERIKVVHPQPLVVKVVTAPIRLVFNVAAHAIRQAVRLIPSAKVGTGNGPLHLRSVKPCSRCTVTTTDQDTGEVAANEEPLVTLKTFRSGAKLGWHPEKWSEEVFFGWNLVADAFGTHTQTQPTSKSIRVGDIMRVTQRRQGPFHQGQ